MASTLRSSMQLLSGSFLAQCFGMLTMPIVTRLYSPGEFGIFSVFISCLGIMAPVCTLRFNEVVILPKDRNEALNVWTLACLSSLACSLLIFLVLGSTFFLPALQARFNLTEYRYILLLVPLGVFIRGINLNTGSLAIRQSIFKKIAVATVLTKFSDRIITIILGTFSFASWGLIIGHLSGVIVAINFLFFTELKKILRELPKALSITELKRLAIKYKHFPIYGPWSIFLHTGAKEFIVFILISVFSATTAGAYALGQNMIITPLYMLSSSLNRVFIRKAASLKETPSLLVKETTDFIGYISYVALPPILTLTFLGDHIFSIFFGREWQTAGFYVQILAPAFFLVFIYNILREFFIIFEKARDRLLFDIVYFLLRGGGLLIAALVFKRADYAISIMSIITCLHIAIFFTYISNLLHLSKTHFILLIVRKILIMLPLICGLIYVRSLYNDSIYLAATVLLFFYLLQGIVIIIVEPPIKKKIKDSIKMLQNRKSNNVKTEKNCDHRP